MLCYQYTRNVTDIIHDTFSWITGNGRLMRLLLILLLPVCIVAEYMSSMMVVDRFNKGVSVIDTIANHYIPFSFGEETVEYAALAQYIHYLLMFLVVICLVPMLRHYFLSCKSLKKLTFKRFAEIVKENLVSTLITAVLAMVAYWLVVVTYETVILPYFILFFAAFPVSSSIMRGNNLSFQGISGNYFLCLRYLFLISFVVIVIQILPLYCCGIFALLEEVIGTSLYSLLPAANDFAKAASFVMGTLTYLSFCFSAVVLFVSLTLFHGTVAVDSEE